MPLPPTPPGVATPACSDDVALVVDLAKDLALDTLTRVKAEADGWLGRGELAAAAGAPVDIRVRAALVAAYRSGLADGSHLAGLR